jgi:hypothetical protein
MLCPVARGDGQGADGIQVAADLAPAGHRLERDGVLFCIVDGRTRGRSLTTTSVRQQLRRTAAKAGVRRRFAPHQLRPRTASALARLKSEGVRIDGQGRAAQQQRFSATDWIA